MSSYGFTLADGLVVRPRHPLFITGSGRCGTTLMRRLVIEHTHTVIPPDNQPWPRAWLMDQAGAEWDLFCRLVLGRMRHRRYDWQRFGVEEDTLLRLLASVPAAWRFLACVPRHLCRAGEQAPTFPAAALTAQEARDIVGHRHLGNVLGAVSGNFISKGRARLPREAKVGSAAVAGSLQRGFAYEPTGETG